MILGHSLIQGIEECIPKEKGEGKTVKHLLPLCN